MWGRLISEILIFYLMSGDLGRKRKKHNKLGKNMRKIIEYMELHKYPLPEDIIKALGNPNKNPKSERNRIYKSILTMKKSGLLIQLKPQGLKIFFDDEYRTKQYPKPRPVRLNKQHELYQKYQMSYRK